MYVLEYTQYMYLRASVVHTQKLNQFCLSKAMKAFRSIPSYPKRLENQRQTNWIFPTRNVFLTLLCGIQKAENVLRKSSMYFCRKRNGFVQMNPIVNTLHLSL